MQDYIYNKTEIQKVLQEEKAFLTFTDLEQAFDKILKEKVWKMILRERTVGEKITLSKKCIIIIIMSIA